MKILRFFVPALLAGLTTAAAAQTEAPLPAEPAPARAWQRRIDNTFVFVLNPLGIMDSIDVTWTKRINRSDDLIHKDAHVAAGVVNRIAPAFLRIGPWFEYSPLSIIDLRVGVEPGFYFGTFKAFLPFESATSNFDDDVIQARQSEARSGFAGKVYFSPTLKARAGPVVARVRGEVAYYRAQEAGEPFYYDPFIDTLVKASGSTVLTIEALVLHEFDLDGGRKLLLGPVYDLTTVRQAPENRKQDIGLIAAWSNSGSFHALKAPTFAAKIVYFLQDPVRRHEPAAFITFAFGL